MLCHWGMGAAPVRPLGKDEAETDSSWRQALGERRIVLLTKTHWVLLCAELEEGGVEEGWVIAWFTFGLEDMFFSSFAIIKYPNCVA